MVYPKERSNTFSHSTTTELPTPVALFLFPKTSTHSPVYWDQNTNCHTTPDSSIPVDTDYSNRFELCVEGYTLPTSLALWSHGQWDPNLNLFLSPHVLTLTVIPEGVRPPPCLNRTKHSPSLSSRCSPAIINHGVWIVRVQIEWLPIQSRVVVLVMSTGSEGW
jgi:hypothetical protein